MAEGHVCGGTISRQFLKFETRKYYFLHSEHHYLVAEKRNNLDRFC
jgi:hypothetical protein